MREHMIVEQDPATGSRLKRYSRAADVDYWTELWQRSMNVSYERERRGHLPHQLRATFRRWVRPNARTLEAGCGLGFRLRSSECLFRRRVDFPLDISE